MLSAYDSAFRGEVVELVEGAALEMLYTLIAYRGFESLSVRHLGVTKKMTPQKSPIRRAFLLPERRKFLV